MNFIYSILALLSLNLILHSSASVACQGNFKPLFRVNIDKNVRETHMMGVILSGQNQPTHLYYSNPNAKKPEKRCLRFDLKTLSRNQALMEESGFVGAMIRVQNQKIILQYAENPRLKFMTTLGESGDDSNFSKVAVDFKCPSSSSCVVSHQGKPLESLEVTVKTKKTGSQPCDEKVVGIKHVEPVVRM